MMTSMQYSRGPMTLRALALMLLAPIACAIVIQKATHASGTSDKNYSEEISRTYDFKFGPNPFAPGNATTTTGTFIPREMFVASKRCGTCHTDAHAQWRQSAHGNAFREPFYQKNVKDLQTQKGIEF